MRISEVKSSKMSLKQGKKRDAIFEKNFSINLFLFNRFIGQIFKKGERENLLVFQQKCHDFVPFTLTSQSYSIISNFLDKIKSRSFFQALKK